MNIQEQFNRIAEEYDKNRRKFIPCFDDFYCSSTAFLSSSIKTPKRILDLGAGTGLLTYYWYQHYSKAQFLLVDIAEEMLKIARKRFQGIESVLYRIMDYNHELPEEDYDTVISALSIHHLENKEKQNLFSRIYDSLPTDGIFVNYDQFCAGQPQMDDWYNVYWENQLFHSGLTKSDIRAWKERKKLDRECSVEQEAAMLQECNFRIVKCVYTCQKFSVILAIK